MSGSQNPRSSKRPRFSHPDGFSIDKSKKSRPNPVHTNIKFSSDFSSDVKTGSESSSSGTIPTVTTNVRHQRNPLNKPNVHTKTTLITHAARTPQAARLGLPPLPGSDAAASSSDRRLSILESTKKLTIPIPPTIEPPTPSKSILKIPKFAETITPETGTVTPRKQKPLSSRPAFKPTPSASASTSSSKRLKTISTTGIALMADLNSEDGAAEILGWSVQQGGVSSSYNTDSERDLMRGLEISPQKPGGRIGRAAGGLAGRAQHMLERKHTSLTLWYKDQEKRQGPPNLTLRISQLLHSSEATERPHPSAAGVRSCLAVCLVSNKDLANDEERIVLFSPQAGSDPDSLKEGQRIVVWDPYHAVQVSSETFTASDALPHTAWSRPTLLCSRFLVK